MKSSMPKWKLFYKKYPFLSYIVIFTCFFIITTGLFYFSFIINHKSFIWIGETKDGLVQHYNALMYFGEYLRALFHNLFINHQFTIPMWDFSMGYGADILATMHYYVIGDPLNLLSIFVSAKYTEYLYIFLIVLRLYLAGLSFSYFCYKMGKDKKSILVGALTYLFCGYTIFASVRHPYFINPMIYLPLLLLGTENILNKQSSRLFIVMLSISAISNFYFLYMLCLLVFIYAVIRFFGLYGMNLKLIFNYLGKFILNVVISLAISSVILLPVISFFMQTARSEYKIAFDHLYNLSYYMSSFFNFNSYNFGGYWTVLSYTSLSVISIIALFIRRNHISLKIAFIILTIIICLPYGGYLFNGLSYVSNRWQFGYSFIVAFISCWMFNDLFKLTKKMFFLIGILCVLYFTGALLYAETNNLNFIISSLIMLGTYIVIGFKNFIPKHMYTDSVVRFSIIIILVFLIINVSVNSFFKYSPTQLNYVKEFVDLKKGYKTLNNTHAKEITKLNDSTFFRYDETNFSKSYLTNAALRHKQHSISFFYSLGSGYTTNYFSEMENVNALSSIYTGLNYRTYLDALASVKYFITEPNQRQYRPYGFNEKVSESDKHVIYKTDLSLPIGYTYDRQISQKDYDNASSIEKQQMLLQGVYLDDNDIGMEITEPQLNNNEISYDIVSQNGIEWNENQFKVLNSKASMILKFKEVKASELYVMFQNLVFYPRKDKKGSYINEAKIGLQSGNVKNTILLKNKYNTYYNGTSNFTMNLGYADESRNEIKIHFRTPGTYTYDSLLINSLPMDQFQDQINKLSHNTLQNIKMETNKVSGNIKLDNKKFLCFSIPYNEGWRLYIDGKEEKLYRANTMYMGALLEEGSHQIELIYTTPYFGLGLIMSVFGIISFAGLLYYEKRRKQ